MKVFRVEVFGRRKVSPFCPIDDPFPTGCFSPGRKGTSDILQTPEMQGACLNLPHSLLQRLLDIARHI